MNDAISIPVLSGIILGLGGVLAGSIAWIDTRTRKAVSEAKQDLNEEITILRSRVTALENGQRESRPHLRTARDEAVRIDNHTIIEALDKAEATLH